MTSQRIKNILLYLGLSVIFVSIFCWVFSPFIHSYTGDGPIFMMLGRMFVDGKIPYVDFFDHKGPSMILVQAIGQFLAPSRNGVFILEVVNLFVVLLLLDKTAKLVINQKKTYIVVGLCLLYLAVLLQTGGNSTEEFSLIPLLVSLYIGCKVLFQKTKVSLGQSFLLGLCFSFLFWLRLNNAGFLCGVVAFLFFNSIFNKDSQSLKSLIIGFFLGQIPFGLSYILYFGYYDAMYDLVYATFLFNMLYLKSVLALLHKMWWINAVMLILVVVSTIIYARKEKDNRVYLLGGLVYIFSLLTINVGYVFKFYFVLYTPILALTLILLFKELNNKVWINISLVSSLVVFFSFAIAKSISLVRHRELEKVNQTNCLNAGRDILSVVPKSETNRVLFYNIPPWVYLVLEVNANYKYFILQDWHAMHDPNIRYEILDLMKSAEGPLWVMCEVENGESKLNSEIQSTLNENYILCAENEEFILFQRTNK